MIVITILSSTQKQLGNVVFLRDVLEIASTMLIRLITEMLATLRLTEIRKLLACSPPLITAVAIIRVFPE